MSVTYGESVLDFGTGDRVELHPATDAWMRGERYGTVLPASPYRAVTLIRVQLDSGRIIRVTPQNLRLNVGDGSGLELEHSNMGLQK